MTPVQAGRLNQIREKYDVRIIVAFGSRVKGNVHEKSDLDVGLLFNHGGLTMDCISDLQDVFPGDEVDPSSLNRADPLFLGQINANCVLLSGGEQDFHDFRRYAFQRFVDFLPYLTLEQQTNALRLETY